MMLLFAELVKTFVIGLAGALGAGSRHFIASHSRRVYGEQFPWGTLIINITGAFLISCLAALAQHHLRAAAWQPALALGFLGGYTTFSTLMLEASRLRRNDARHLHFAYLGLSLILGLLAAILGLALGKVI